MRPLTFALAGLAILALTAIGYAGAQMMGGNATNGGWNNQGMGGMNSAAGRARERDFWRGGAAAEYRRARNPLAADAKTLAMGRTVYQENCAACHGDTGRGDGEAGQDLNPKPVDLARMRYRDPGMGGLMFYAVSEGGEPYGTAMPAFKDALSETERWAVITYIQSGLGG